MNVFDRQKDILYYFLYFLLTILILWNLLLQKYVLTLDMVFGEHEKFSRKFFGIDFSPIPSLSLGLIIELLNLILPVWVIEKILLFGVLFLSGVSAYNLCPSKSRIGKFFAGLVYMINPFVFLRFLAGHLLLLLSYSVFPLFLKYLMEYLEKNKTKDLLKTVIFLSITGLTSQFLLIAFSILSLFVLGKIIKEKDILYVKSFIKILIPFILVNSYWILPLLLYSDTLLKVFTHLIGPEDLSLFTSKQAINFNVVFNVASMHGFWREGYDYAKFHLPFWYLIFFGILYLTIHGFIILNRNKKFSLYTKLLVLVALASLILATGISHPIFSKIFDFLFDKFVIFRGFREPHKFVVVLALAYSFFGGVGISDFVNSLDKQKHKKILTIFIVIVLFLPIIYSYTMFFGFNKQIDAVDYPKEWYEANNYLNEDKQDFNVLFLPWHLYMDFGFTPKQRISNPANVFFSKGVIHGDNIEAGNIYSQSTNPVSKYIESLLFNNYRIDNFGELVAPLNVKYIILAKEVDWGFYQFLFNQTDLEMVMNNTKLVVFKNKVNAGKVYSVDDAFVINRDDIIKLSKKQDITKAVYFLQDNNTVYPKDAKIATPKTKVFSSNRSQIIDYESTYTMKFELKEKPKYKYLVFSERYSEIWNYGNKKPASNLGITNVFVVDNDTSGTTIIFSRSVLYIAGYLVSFISVIFIAFLLKKS